MSDRGMDLRHPDGQPQPRTAAGLPHHTHLAVSLWSQHPGPERAKSDVFVVLVKI